VIGVADGDGERVGGVVGPRRLGQREQRLDHPGHLALVGAPVPAHRSLDLLRGVVDAVDALLAGGEQDDAPRLADRERRPDVLTEIQCFEGDGVGPVLLDELAQTRVDGGQPARGGQPGGGGDDPAVGGHEPMATPNDDSEAAVGKAGIDAEDHHRTVILRGGPDASLRPGRARCTGADYPSTPSTFG
jgi:hypothetical protein